MAPIAVETIDKTDSVTMSEISLKQESEQEKVPLSPLAERMKNQTEPEPVVPLTDHKIQTTVHNITVLVNNQPVILKNKSSYILVDVLDFYPFDLSVAGGSSLATLVNGIQSDFTKPLAENDRIEIFWRP